MSNYLPISLTEHRMGNFTDCVSHVLTVKNFCVPYFSLGHINDIHLGPSKNMSICMYKKTR